MREGKGIMKVINIAISILIINVAIINADVGKWLNKLSYPTNIDSQNEAFYKLLKIKNEKEIKEVQKYLTKKNLTEKAKIDIIIILVYIQPDNKYWSEFLFEYLPKNKKEFWALDNNYRLLKILDILKNNIMSYDDEKSWEYIKLYQGFSDGYIAEAYGPIYAYLLQNKTDLFIKYLTRESNINIRRIASNIVQYDETLSDVCKNILKEKENDIRKQNDVINKLNIYIDDYKINHGY